MNYGLLSLLPSVAACCRSHSRHLEQKRYIMLLLSFQRGKDFILRNMFVFFGCSAFP